LSSDPEKLGQRITNVVQKETRREVLARSLEQTLRESETIAASVRQRIQAEALLENLGVELLAVHFASIKATPEVSKALEAEYRETLLRQADEAIYARRAAAVEESARSRKTNWQPTSRSNSSGKRSSACRARTRSRKPSSGAAPSKPRPSIAPAP
jgi:regulator of protease activity HflC (stomatin/prohibitin superfamily)